MLAPCLYKVPSAVSSSLTRQRSEADLITGERTLRSQCVFETEACGTFGIFFLDHYFIHVLLLHPRSSGQWSELPLQKSSAAGWKWAQAGHSDPDQASPGANEKVASRSHFELLRPPPSKLCHSTGIPLAEEKDERNKQKEWKGLVGESSDWHWTSSNEL